jgi:hypothetical protein
VEEELSVGVCRVEGPEKNSIIERAGDEFVAAGGDGKASYGGGVAFEIAKEEVVMGREVADGILGLVFY